MNKTISLSGRTFTVGELKAFLATIGDAPANAKIRIEHVPADRQYEGSIYTLSATYRINEDNQ